MPVSEHMRAGFGTYACQCRNICVPVSEHMRARFGTYACQCRNICVPVSEHMRAGVGSYFYRMPVLERCFPNASLSNSNIYRSRV